MAVRRRSDDGKWMVDIRWRGPDGRRMRKRVISPIQTRNGAQEYERELLRELALSGFKEPEPAKEIPTLSVWSRDFLDVYAATNNKPSEVDSKESIMRVHLLPVLGELRLNQIKKQDIERYKARKLNEGKSRKTINNHLTVLRRMLAVAEEWELIDSFPRIQWLKAPKPKFDWLDFDETERLLDKVDDDWREMVLLAVRTGMRLGELRGLAWHDVDLTKGVVTVRRSYVRGTMGTPKNHRTRRIPITANMIAALKKHRHLRGELVFCGVDGNPLPKTNCRRALHNACRLANLRPIGWHVLRHSFASHLAMKGVALKVIQELMGHATVEMTLRYAHLAPSALEESLPANWTS